MISHIRWILFLLVFNLATSFLAAQGMTGTSAGGAMPNECCPKKVFKPMEFGPETPPGGGKRGRPAPTTPGGGKKGGKKGGKGDGDDEGNSSPQWNTTSYVTTEGLTTGTIAVPTVGTGLQGLAEIYRSDVLVNLSLPSWDGSGGVLTGGETPIPPAHLLAEPGSLQPRLGNMPGLYLYQDTTNNEFYHYGTPVETGVAPDTTAHYTEISSQSFGGPSSAPTVYINQLSGAQMHYFASATPAYTEVRHVDGTVARFESIPLVWSSGSQQSNVLWHLKEIRDPYDNVATYVYDSAANARLIRIEYPSGLHESYDYSPSWVNSWAGGSTVTGLEVSYTQNGIADSSQNWGMVFEHSFSGNRGSHFGGRIKYVLRSVERVLLEQSETPYSINTNSTVNGQIVDRFSYALAQGSSPSRVSQYHAVHTGTAFVGPTTSDPALPEVERYRTTSLANGRASSVLSVQSAILTTFTYPAATRVAPGVTLSAIRATDSLGNSEVFEVDVATGRVFREKFTPSNDFLGRPRAIHAQGENQTYGAPATSDIEPESITSDNYFDATCTCQKPIERRLIASIGGQTTTRIEKFEYFTDSKLLKKHTITSPATSGPTEISWQYTYVQAKSDTQTWGAWLPETEVTPDGTFEYAYSNWVDRVNATDHGRMAGTTERRMFGVRTQDTLAGAPSVDNSVAVGATTHRNLPNMPGGLAFQGPLQGAVRQTVTTDGITHTTNYAPEGWTTSVALASGTSLNSFGRDPFGRATSVTVNASSAIASQTLITDASAAGTVYRIENSSGGLPEVTEYFYDRYGHLTVLRHNNLASSGSKPSKHGASGSARDWVENQYHYQGGLIMEEFIDRKPLDEAAGGNQFQKMAYSYHSNGRLDTATLPNGSSVKYDFDSFGTLYRSTMTSPNGQASLATEKTFVNPFLDVTATYQNTGAEMLVTTIARNAAGSITSIEEPSISVVPPGYSGDTSGAVHQFDVDAFGRVIEARAYTNVNGSLVLQKRAELEYDQLGRQISQHEQILAGATGDQYAAWKFKAGGTQLESEQSTGNEPTIYQYGNGGLLDSITRGGNIRIYGYYPNTPYLKQTSTNEADGLGGVRTTIAKLDVDALGRVRATRRGISPELVTTYDYNSLGLVDRVVGPSQREQKFLTDALGRVVEHVRVESAGGYAGNWSVFEDSGFADGRIKRTQIDAQGNATVVHLDFAGRAYVLQQPGGNVAPTSTTKNRSMCLFVEYDDAGRMSSVFDGDGGQTRFWHDGQGRMIQRELVALGSNIATMNTKEVFLRNGLGKLSQVHLWGASSVTGTTPNNSRVFGVEAFTRDSIGRTHAERFWFASAPGNIVENLSAYLPNKPYRQALFYRDGLTGTHASLSAPVDVAFQEDSLGRLTNISWNRSPGSSALNALANYEWVGSLRRARTVQYGAGASASGTATYVWDQFNRSQSITDDVIDAGGNTTTVSSFDYEFNTDSNLTKEKYSKVDGSVGDRHGYDDQGRLSKSWIGTNAAVMNAGADPSGFDASQMHEQLTYGLDSAENRSNLDSQKSVGIAMLDYALQGMSHPQGASNRYVTIGAPNAPVTHLHDDRGNLRFDGRFLYRYDFLNRLQEIWVVDVNGQAPAGSRFAVNSPDALSDAVANVTSSVVNLMGRVAREHLDPAFRAQLKAGITGGVMLVTAPSGGGGSQVPPFFDSANLCLYAVYGYDAGNRRTQRVVIGSQTTFHTYDGLRETTEHALDSSNGSWKAAPAKQFVWGASLDELVSYRRKVGGNWETYYVVQGGQDTSAKLLDANGIVQEQFEYDPFGQVSVYDGSGSQVGDGRASGRGLPFLWKGLRTDPETGFLYMRNRFYDPAHGRFLTLDPLGLWADPLNAGNGYAYCGNRPLSMGDPLGLQGKAPNPQATVNLTFTLHEDGNYYAVDLQFGNGKVEGQPAGKQTVRMPPGHDDVPIERKNSRHYKTITLTNGQALTAWTDAGSSPCRSKPKDTSTEDSIEDAADIADGVAAVFGIAAMFTPIGWVGAVAVAASLIGATGHAVNGDCSGLAWEALGVVGKAVQKVRKARKAAKAGRGTTSVVPSSYKRTVGHDTPWDQMTKKQRKAFQHSYNRHGTEMGLPNWKQSQAEQLRQQFNDVVNNILENGTQVPGQIRKPWNSQSVLVNFFEATIEGKKYYYYEDAATGTFISAGLAR